MAKGPSWTSWEDGVLEAARQARVTYERLTLVMPHRTPVACRVRANVLRRERGVPSRDYAHLEEQRWRMRAVEGSQRLAEAIGGVRGRS